MVFKVHAKKTPCVTEVSNLKSLNKNIFRELVEEFRLSVKLKEVSSMSISFETSSIKLFLTCIPSIVKTLCGKLLF